MDLPLLKSFAIIAFPLLLLAASLAPAPASHGVGVSVAASTNQTFYS